jgi:hypothetical protein
MIMNAVLAIALGLTPAQPGKDVQKFNYDDKVYGAMVGSFRQVVDRRGTTYLRGVHRLTGRPFELTVKQDGSVEGTVGDTYVTFTVRDDA